MDQCSFDTVFCGQQIKAFYIKEAATAAEFIDALLQKDVLFGLDTETAAHAEYRSISTAALSPHLARVRLLQIFDGKNAIVFDLDSIRATAGLELFLEFLETKRFMAHYAQFDLGMLRSTFGIKRIHIGCTQILYRIVSHAVYPVDIGAASLEALCDSILKVPLPKAAQRSDWNERDLTFEQIEYSAIDPVAVIKIAEKLAHNLKKYSLEATYKLAKDVQHPIVEMQMNGMLLDWQTHQNVVGVWGEELWQARKELEKFTGIKNITDPAIGRWLEANLSREETLIWPRTETGKFSTSAHAFAEFSYLPIVKPIAVYKRLEKLSSSFGNNLIAMINPATGRIHTHFNIAGARTGRLSSSKPNMQQYPNDNELRSHFIPGRGKAMVCADFSQIEVRVAAEISQDEKMLAVYANGLDIYSATAAHLTNQPIESIHKQSRERKIAKALVLGLLFGLGAAKFSHYAKKGYEIDVSHDEATENIQAFRDLYETFRWWQLAQAKRCKSELTVRTIGGKARRLADDNFYGPGLNHPVQGTAAEIIFHALIKLHTDFLDTDVRLVNCVHDEIIVECPPDIALDVSELMQIRMTESYQELFPKGVTRGLVNVDVGTSWGEAKPS